MNWTERIEPSAFTPGCSRFLRSTSTVNWSVVSSLLLGLWAKRHVPSSPDLCSGVRLFSGVDGECTCFRWLTVMPAQLWHNAACANRSAVHRFLESTCGQAKTIDWIPAVQYTPRVSWNWPRPSAERCPLGALISRPLPGPSGLWRKTETTEQGSRCASSVGLSARLQSGGPLQRGCHDVS